LLLERKKVHIGKQLERQSKVGYNLSRLKIARLQIEKVLEETEQFNERILDPKSWQKKIRALQDDEQSDLSRMRISHKLRKLIGEDPENQQRYMNNFKYRRNTHQPQHRV